MISLVYSTGAALHVAAPHVPRLFSELPNNPLCVFLFEQDGIPPNLWHTRNVSRPPYRIPRMFWGQSTPSMKVLIHEIELLGRLTTIAPKVNIGLLYNYTTSPWKFGPQTIHINTRSLQYCNDVGILQPAMRVIFRCLWSLLGTEHQCQLLCTLTTWTCAHGPLTYHLTSRGRTSSSGTL